MVSSLLDPSKSAHSSKLSSIESSVFSESCYNRMSRQFSNKTRPSKSAPDYQRCSNQHLVLNRLVEFGDNESVDSKVEMSRIEKRS